MENINISEFQFQEPIWLITDKSITLTDFSNDISNIFKNI